MATERSVLIRLKGNISDFQKAMLEAAAGVAALRKEINTTNDRTAWLVQGILALAPALAPIGAAAVPALVGLSTQMTVAAGAAGVALLAFNGVGDALKALNQYQLEPTAEHLTKLHETMGKIGPEGESFVRFLDRIGPKYSDLVNATREPLFEGTEKGIKSLTDNLLPRLKTIATNIAEALGGIAAEGGKNLAGPKFEAFFDYLKHEAKPLLRDLARTLGNFVEGIGNMMVAFGPLTDRFSTGLLRMSRAFANWSEGLDENDSFQAFLDYIDTAIPMTMDFLGALISAMAALAEAAAPVGDILLPAFTAFLHVVEALAKSPLGPIFLAAASAASLYGRALALAEITTGGAMGKITQRLRDNTGAALKARFAWRDLGNTMVNAALSAKQLDERGTWGKIGKESADRAKEARKNMGAYATSVAGTVAQVAGLALVMSDLDDKVGLTNTAMLALMGSMAGPWGVAAGAVIGMTIDIGKLNDAIVDLTSKGDQAEASGSLTSMLESQAALLKQITHDQQNSIGWHWLYDDDLHKAEKQYKDLGVAIETARDQLTKRVIIDHGGDRGQGQMFHELQDDADRARIAMEDLADSIGDVQLLLDRSGSLVAYERALDDLRKSIEENGNTFDASIEKGRKNIEARNTLVDKAIARADLLKKQGDDLGAQRILTRAIDDLERFAARTPQAKRALQPFIDELKRANDTDVKPKVKVQGVPKAVQDLHVVETAMDALHDKVIRLRIEHQDVRLGPSFADGGSVRGRVHGPGGPRDDKVKANLSPGEYVQPVAAVQKYGMKMMEEIRSLRFAEGGQVPGGAPAWSGAPGMDYQRFAAAASALSPAPTPPIDYKRLAAAVAKAAPMYGTAHFHSDGDYERAKTEHDQMVSMGGV